MAILSHGQVGVIVLFSVIVTLNALTYCPSGLVSVSANGSLIFQSLSTRSRDNSSNYDPGAIGGWYSLPSGFIDVVRSGSLPYVTIKNVLRSLNVSCAIPGLNADCTSIKKFTVSSFDPVGLITSFVGWLAGLIVVTLIGGILAFSFLICCCCFWCCRCCGNCGGGKTQKVTKNRDCMTFSFTSILLLFTILLFIGVILAFFSNEQIYRSLDNSQDSIHTLTGPGANFINDTLTEIEELLCQLVAPSNSIFAIIFDRIRGFGLSLDNELGKIESNVFETFSTLETLPAGLNSTIDALSNVTSSTQALVTSFDALQTILVSISDDVSTLLSACMGTGNTMICSMIPQPNAIRAAADYNALPNVTSELEAAQRALENFDISNSVAEGQSEFDNVKQSISNSTDEIITDVTNKLESSINLAHDSIKRVTTALRVFLDDSQVRSQCPTLSDGSIFTNLETNINKILANTYTGQIPNVGYIQECIVNQGFEYMQQFDVYRYAFGVIVCSVSLITAVSVLFGVVLGMIGFRKDVDPTERTRLSHCGGTILLIGATVAFVLGFLLMILAALMFFFGASTQKLCNSLIEPSYPLFSELIDDQEFWGGSLGGHLLFQKIGSSSRTDAVLSVSDALRNCERNEALFTAFNLSNLLPTGSVSTQIQTSINIEQVEKMVEGLVNEAFQFTNTTFLPEEAMTSLQEFVDADVQSINITEFVGELDKRLLAFDINQTIENLTDFRNSLQASGSPQPLLAQVEQLITKLRSLASDHLPVIINQVDTLKADVMQLESFINTTVMTTVIVVNGIDGLMDDLSGPTLTKFLDGTVEVTIKRTIGYINEYVNHLEHVVTRNVSRCRPLWRLFTNTYDAVCGSFLNGLNGFWWSLGFCCLLLVVVIIFSVVTSSYFLRRQSEEKKEENGVAHALYPMKPVTTDLAIGVEENNFKDEELLLESQELS